MSESASVAPCRWLFQVLLWLLSPPKGVVVDTVVEDGANDVGMAAAATPLLLPNGVKGGAEGFSRDVVDGAAPPPKWAGAWVVVDAGANGVDGNEAGAANAGCCCCWCVPNAAVLPPPNGTAPLDNGALPKGVAGGAKDVAATLLLAPNVIDAAGCPPEN
jgi:hypothetical protein